MYTQLQRKLVSILAENNPNKIEEILSNINDNNTAIILLIKAISFENTDIRIVEALVNTLIKFNTNIQNNLNEALLAAASTDRVDIIKLLLDNKANIETEDYKECTPLWIASDYNRQLVISLLLESGANIEVISLYKESILDQAIFSGDINRIQQLINYGVNIDFNNRKAVDQYSSAKNRLEELLKYTTEKEFIQVSQWLIDQGADVNCKFIQPTYHKKINELVSLRNSEANLSELDLTKIEQKISLIKMLINNGIVINKFLEFSAVDKYIPETAKLVDSLFTPHDDELIILDKIDLDIFVTRFGNILKNYNSEFNELNEIIDNFFKVYDDYSEGFNENDKQIDSNIIKLIESKFISSIHEGIYKNGFNFGYLEKLKNPTKIPNVVKEIEEFVNQAQEDFNLECAIIFSETLICRINEKGEIVKLTSAPLTTLIEDLKDNNIDINSINNRDIQELFNYYNYYSSLKYSDIESYLANQSLTKEDIAVFKAKVTAANIEIFQKNIFTIMEECPSNIIIYLLEQPIPIKLINFIDIYFLDKFFIDYEPDLKSNFESDSVDNHHDKLSGEENLYVEDC